jgi:hypothetical protein
MEISAILLARAIAFVEANDLNPRGAAYFPALVPLLVNRFNFQKYPQQAADFDETRGIVFELGHTGEVTVDKVTLWGDGIGIDVRSSTTDAKNLIDSVLTWLKHEAGLHYEPRMINRWGFLSQLTFFSDVDLVDLNPAVAKLAANVSASVLAEQKLGFSFVPSGFSVGFDKSLIHSPVAMLTVQRRATVPFDNRKFFSEGPLPTEAHIQVLEQFERDFKSLPK